jgi:hypothetical protein
VCLHGPADDSADQGTANGAGHGTETGSASGTHNGTGCCASRGTQDDRVTDLSPLLLGQ